MTLLEETIEALKPHSPAEVLWVGDSHCHCTWAEFADVADVDYPNGFGTNLVSASLVIVGDGWWLARCLSETCEWWELREPPVVPSAVGVPVVIRLNLSESQGGSKP